MKKAQALNILFSMTSLFCFIFAIFSGPTPEYLVALVILALGFFHMVDFHFTRDDKFSRFLPVTVLALFLVLGYGIRTFVFSEFLNEVRISALMSVTPTFILIGILLEIFNREN